MEQNIDLSPYFRILRKWWWLLVLCTAVAGGFSYEGTRQMPRIYQATTTVMVGQTIQMANPSGTDIYTSQQLAQTYAQLATRQPILQGAAQSLGLEAAPSAGDITARQVSNTQLLEISVRDVDPVRAGAVADAVAQQLVLQSSGMAGEEGQRQAFVAEQLVDLEQNIEDTRAEIASEQAKLDAANSARAIQQYQANIAALQQKLNTYRATHATLLLSVEGGSNYVSVVEPAVVPTRPISPNVPQTVAVAAGLGLLLATLGAVLAESLHNVIESPEDVITTLKLPYVGAVGVLPRGDAGSKRELLCLHDPNSSHAEAFRFAAMVLRHSLPQTSRRAIMITSSAAEDGKSTLATSLAIIEAQAGRRVILVDADLRRATQHDIWSLPNDAGLSSVLAGQGRWEDVIQPSAQDGLTVITSGPQSSLPMALLSSPVFVQLVAALSEQADLVIVDTPPILGVAEAGAMVQAVGGVVLVARAGLTPRPACAAAADLVAKSEGLLLGVFLNALKAHAGSRYGSGGYGYGYGNRYGYAYQPYGQDRQARNSKRKTGRTRRHHSGKSDRQRAHAKGDESAPQGE